MTDGPGIIAGFCLGALAIGLGWWFYARSAARRIHTLERLLGERENRIGELEEAVRQGYAAQQILKEKENLLLSYDLKLNELREENLRLARENTALTKEKQAEEEKNRWLEVAEGKLREVFESLAGQVLKGNAEEFLKRTHDQLDLLVKQLEGNLTTHKVELKGLVEPLEKTLKILDDEIRTLEQKREGAYQGILRELLNLEKVTLELRQSATNLDRALSSPSVRGHWGELQLRRIVELAGMAEHVDYDRQVQVEGWDQEKGKIDMVVRLIEGGGIPVDAKVPMESYRQALEAESEEKRRLYMQKHSQALLNHVRELSRRAYHEKIKPSPGFTVLFLPSESFLVAAFEEVPELFDRAFENQVLIATPIIFFALLRTIAEGWRQFEWNRNAERFLEEGRTLYARIVTFAEYLGGVGKGLELAIRKYNEAVGSWESRLMPSLRKFSYLGRIGSEPPAPELITEGLRTSRAFPDLNTTSLRNRDEPPSLENEGENKGNSRSLE